MPSDRSRRIDPPANNYIAPVAQQGRVVLDRDFNAWTSLLGGRLAAETIDVVGPCGTPDDGFAISAPPASPPGSIWSPPQPESPPSDSGTGRDFLISGGTMYVGGLRVEWPVAQGGQTIAYTYEDQPELSQPVTGLIDYILRRPPQELVYLDVLLQEVSAAEDPDLLDVALGGPDTTQRLKQRARVERFGVNSTACADAWTQAVANWASEGLTFDPATMRLSPAVQLQVGFTQTGPSGGPCDPIAAGGFLGPDNQLIRVQVADGNLLWSYDNASFVYRIQVASDRQTVTLIGGPPDTYHYPQTGQVVEVLATASVIDSVPDEIDGGSIVRCSAQPYGELFTLTQPYGPSTQGATTNVLVLPQPLDAALVNSGLPLFLRVWQAELPLSLNTPITLADSEGNSTGLTVTLSGASVAADGANWQIAVRPSTPQGVYPEELLLAPQPADGPFRVVCPLAVIDWAAGTPPTISDCRSTFDSLVALSKRKPGCCTISISPADLAGRVTLQGLIDVAAAKNQGVVVCLAAGVYNLSAPLHLTLRHSGITIEACGGQALLRQAPGADASLFAGGLITLNGAAGVTLQGLLLRPPLVALSKDLLSELSLSLSQTAQSEAGTLLRTPSCCIGIHAYNATALRVTSCGIAFAKPADTANIDLVAMAMLLQGDCTGLQVEKCLFESAIAPTYNAIDPQTDYAKLIDANRLDFAAAPQTQAATPAPTPTQTPAPAPAPASTPAPTAAYFDVARQIYTGAGLAQIVAGRGNATSISLQRSMVASCGIVATTQGAPPGTDAESLSKADFAATLTDCTLDAALIRDNNFVGLTFASLMVANAQALRLQDNNVGGGVAGFWFSLASTTSPSGVAEGTDKYYNTVLNFEEFQALFGLSPLIPPPPAAPVVREAGNLSAPTEQASRVALGINASIIVTGNHVSTGQHPPAAANPTYLSTTPPGLTSLLLWLDADVSADQLLDSDISAVVANNHLIAATRDAPASLLVLASGQACAVTGNIILNQPGPIGSDRDAPSLWLVIADTLKVTQPFAATGNVLRGISDLEQLTRGTASGRAGWSGYNADPF
jgi:hypothetical protein